MGYMVPHSSASNRGWGDPEQSQSEKGPDETYQLPLLPWPYIGPHQLHKCLMLCFLWGGCIPNNTQGSFLILNLGLIHGGARKPYGGAHCIWVGCVWSKSSTSGTITLPPPPLPNALLSTLEISCIWNILGSIF